MNIVKATNKNKAGILNIISECIKTMEAKGIYQWNRHYPDSETIESDIESGSAYVIMKNNDCIAYTAINEEQPCEYKKIKWSVNGDSVLVIHRLSVHPEFQGIGVAVMFLEFIEDFAVRKGFSSIRLDAYSANTAALRLYEKRGYQKSGKGFFPYRDLPFFFYEKSVE